MKILLSHKNLKIDGSFSENETNFLLLLEDDPHFEKYVQNARKEHMPEEGFNLDVAIEEYNKVKAFEKLRFDLIDYHSNIILSFFHLPSSWKSTVSNIILFNVATTPDHELFPPVSLNNDSGMITLTITENLTVSDISKFLYENKEKIDQMRKFLPGIPIIKGKNLEQKKMMKPYNKTGEKKINVSVLSEIEKEYGKNAPYTSDYSHVSKGRYKYRSYLNKKLTKDWRNAFVASTMQHKSSK